VRVLVPCRHLYGQVLTLRGRHDGAAEAMMQAFELQWSTPVALSMLPWEL
jgi:Flp pilus assembly protein TadD